MIFTDAILDKFTVHYTGNKQNGQALLLSRQEQDLRQETRQKMTEALLQRWPNCHERYTFHHNASLEYNEVYNFIRELFTDPSLFQAQSEKIASHLYEVSLHPKIRPGELYIASFSNIQVDDQPVEAICVFKAETKTLFADAIARSEGI